MLVLRVLDFRLLDIRVLLTDVFLLDVLLLSAAPAWHVVLVTTEGLALSPDRFATMRFVLRHRSLFVGILTALPLVAGGYLGWRSGVPEFAVAGLLLAPVAWVVARVLLELLDVVAETLLPR